MLFQTKCCQHYKTIIPKVTKALAWKYFDDNHDHTTWEGGELRDFKDKPSIYWGRYNSENKHIVRVWPYFDK